MLIFPLFILNLFILALLIFHSYIHRGLRLTINFFILGFLWIFNKPWEERVRYVSGKGIPPHSNLLIILMTTCAWLTIFYISWVLAEKVIKRIGYFKDNLFAVLLLSGLIIASISHCIEIILMHVGWWQGRPMYTISGFLNNNSRLILSAWFVFSGYFLLGLAAFFLIECSKYRKTNWKCLLFLLFFIREWFFIYSGPLKPGVWRIIESLIFATLFILSLICTLRLEYPYSETSRDRKLPKLISSNIPFLSALLILLIVFIIDIFVLKQPLMLISIIPAMFFILLYFDKIPFWIPLVLSLPFIILWEQRFILNIAPVAFVLILYLFSRIKGENSLIQ